jgi:hypothetical protein
LSSPKATFGEAVILPSLAEMDFSPETSARAAVIGLFFVDDVVVLNCHFGASRATRLQRVKIHARNLGF